MTMSFDKPYTNRGLFADNFLETRLPDLAGWRQTDGLEAAFRAIGELYRQKAAKFGSSTNEAQTESNFIRPVLDLLWGAEAYQVQVTLPTLGAAARQPDYALFRTAAERDAAEEHKGAPDYWTNVACVGDAKRWTASLDKERGAENPSAQITNYLYRSKVRWGILTNGRQWRLYEQEKSRQGGVYFEVDLVQLIIDGSLDDFRWFYHFFRRAAVLPDPAGQSFLERVFEGSVTYAAEVGDRLKESVYDALRLLIGGLLDHAGNGLDRHDPETLRQVHNNALIVLYRLLFLFYAEDRRLLPYEQDPYADVSLYRLHREVNARLRSGGTYTAATRQFWPRLMNLFELIDQGFPDGGIPEYNGGLFSPRKHPHVAYTPQDGHRRWEVGDHALAQVIDLLAYDRQPGAHVGHRDIDYATLAVQHLGSIYEGLLELQPRLATEPMVEVVRGKSATFVGARHAVPLPDPHARRIETNGIYLATDRGERKATGSYYTPKYIVDYIVEHTIDPLVIDAAAAVAALRPEVESRIGELAARRESIPELDQATRADLAHAIEAERARLLEPYLSLKVLDPAMGSGHFLVGAADFLALAMATDPNLPAVDTSDDDPQLQYKRLVVERCLYGVDLNPLSVELAKLSLWLHTVSSNRALSFLDHHLRCGNSLIGARLTEDLSTEPARIGRGGKVVRDPSGQMTFGFTDTLRSKHLQYLLDTFRKIAEAPAGDAASERAKARWYEAMDAVRDRFREVANCWLAPYFGSEVTAEEYERAVESLRDGAIAGAAAPHSTATARERVPSAEDLPAADHSLPDGRGAGEKIGDESWFAAAQTLAATRRFFHWELEFPEAFLSPSGLLPADQRGFDAVIGNPPYVRQEQLGDQKPYFEDRYAEVYHGMADLFVYFFGHGLELARPGHRLSYISSNSWLQTNFAEPLRRQVRTAQTVETLIDLGNNRTFEEAPDVCPSIFVIRRTPAPADHRFGAAAFDRGEAPRFDPATFARKVLHVTQADQPDAGWQLTDDATRRLVAKLMDAGRPLGEVVGGRMYYGVKTGLNEAFIIDQATRDRLVAEHSRSAEILKPLVRGEDLRPWYQEEEGRWLVRVPSGWTREAFGPGLTGDEAWQHFGERYPAVAGWLEPFADRAIARQDKGDYWWELRPCVYYDAFEQPKIFWPDILKLPRFSWDDQGKYCNDTGSILAVPDPSLVARLQSRVSWFGISFVALHNKYRDGLWEYRLKSQFVERIPILPVGTAEADWLGQRALAIGDDARSRHTLHNRTRHRLLSDLGTPTAKLNQKLTAWWTLDFAGLRAEVKGCFKHDIPVAERDQWEAWFATQKAEHDRLTGRIVDLETELNDRVYHLYDLTRDEIAIVERVTKYEYGEV